MGLAVNFHVPRPADSLRPALGCIQFDPLVIDVYEYDTPNAGRSRFTLAHELAHHLLGHGKYLVRESCDESDFVLQRRAIIDGSDIARMEFQANYFASSLLLPRIHIIEDFRRLAHELGIVDKGYGHLYVDDQLCNVQNYEIVTGHLMGKYSVSRAVARIRLEVLGLLCDARGQSGLRAL